MSLKSWVLDRMNGISSRADLAPANRAHEREHDPRAVPARATEPLFAAERPEPALFEAAHLGAYGPLIAAIRDELEHFVASQVRLHLAIADRDRFLMTMVAVDCLDGPEPRRLLQQFMREFKPEQVKRYLVREVIAGLPNAAAIDLAQFTGLADAGGRAAAEEADEYRELIAALAAAPPAAVRPYRVEIVGRWTETDAVHPAGTAPRGVPATPPRDTPVTPLAGQRFEFDVEDADGKRRVVLQAVVPGRRYLVGKGEGCDIRVNGTYTSRRHAEFWIEGGAWRATDAGSTNGIRLESRSGARVCSDSKGEGAAAAEPPLSLDEGDRIVLSARAEGSTSEYPWIALRPATAAATRATPIASTIGAVPKTPLTAVRSAGEGDIVLKITLLQAGGERTLELHAGALPIHVGRSRNQTLVVDRSHDGVSGHHLDIVELDVSGAQVVVHGDNGVLVEGVPHASGAQLYWKAGETLVLGASAHDDPTCTLMLDRIERA